MRAVGLASACLALLVACVGDSPSTTPDAATPDASNPDVAQPDTGTPDAGLATVSIVPAAPRLLQGASLDVTVTFARNGLTGPIALTASGAQTGTTITVAPIGDGTLTTQMKITTGANALVGVAPITLKAPGVADFTFPLVVAGPTGTLDTSFDGDGIVLETSLGTGFYDAALVQPDGKLLVAGSTSAAPGQWILRRYEVDGTPDATFNANILPDLPAVGVARSIAIDPKGRILVGGSAGSGTAQLGILRLNASGKADQSFGTSGLVVTSTVNFGQGLAANAIATRADSSIIAAAETGVPHGRLFRFLEDGTRDNAFSYETGNGSASGALTSVFVLPQDFTFSTGTNLVGGTSPLAVRLQASGSPDLNFATGGTKNYIADAKFCTARTAARTGNGDVVMLGVDNTGSPSCEVRIDANGAFKWKVVENTSLNGQPGGITPGPSDGTYSDGWYGGSQDKKGYVRRRLAGGGLDATFAGGGEVSFEDPNTPDAYVLQFKAITTTADGRIVAVGQRTGSASPGPIIYRLWP